VVGVLLTISCGIAALYSVYSEHPNQQLGFFMPSMAHKIRVSKTQQQNTCRQRVVYQQFIQFAIINMGFNRYIVTNVTE